MGCLILVFVVALSPCSFTCTVTIAMLVLCIRTYSSDWSLF